MPEKNDVYYMFYKMMFYKIMFDNMILLMTGHKY